MRLEMYWADTASRGGLSRGLRRSILKGRCDVFMGVSESGDDVGGYDYERVERLADE